VTVINTGLFSQLLSHFPRAEFSRKVAEHQAERHSKGFTCYAQFVAMLFCHLARAESLREICYGLKCCGGKLRHLGLAKAPAVSTLSYANRNRPAGLYSDLFFTLLKRLRAQSAFMRRKHRFDFENKLLLLDATIIDLSLALFPWADFNRVKGGVKVHVVLDAADYLPRYVAISDVRPHDVQYARGLSLPQGSIVAMDKGYMDLRLFYRWTSEGVFFVTPLKPPLRYITVNRRPLAPGGAVISDEMIMPWGVESRRDYPQPLRRVELLVDDGAGGKRNLVLLSNHFGLDADVIGAIYKERWQIELFFKALKQNLVLRHFVGSTRNAIEIQIWTAMISMLLLKWLRYMSECTWSLSNLAAALRLQLFVHRPLRDFLNKPWDPPPEAEEPAQLSLRF
jgi:hypothetical protein